MMNNEFHKILIPLIKKYPQDCKSELISFISIYLDTARELGYDQTVSFKNAPKEFCDVMKDLREITKAMLLMNKVELDEYVDFLCKKPLLLSVFIEQMMGSLVAFGLIWQPCLYLEFFMAQQSMSSIKALAMKTAKIYGNSIQKYIAKNIQGKELYKKLIFLIPMWLYLVPDEFKTQEMCDRAVSLCENVFYDVPDKFRTVELCNQAAAKDPEVKGYVEEYKRRKALKQGIYDDLLPIAWHPDRFFNWCVPEDEKKDLEIMWSS